MKNMIIGMLLVIVVGVIGVGVYASNQDKDAAKSPPSKSTTTNSNDESTAVAKGKFSDACAVISKANLEAAFGTTFQEPKKSH